MDDITDFEANKFEAIDEKYLEAFEGTEEEQLAQAKKNPGVVLKALKHTCDDLQTDITKMKRDVDKMTKDKNHYEDYLEGNITKKVTRNLLNRTQKAFNELGAIQLRKVKVEKIVEVEEVKESAVVYSEGKSMKSLASFFENGGDNKSSGVQKKVTYGDEGNVKKEEVLESEQYGK